jgi:hypothetical protein
MRIQPNKVLYQFYRGIMPQLLPMAKLEQVKHILWRDLNTILVTHREVLSPEVWRKFSNLSKCNQVKILLSWSV